MRGDDLNRPLGLEPSQSTRPFREIGWNRIALGGVATIAVSLGAFVWLTDARRSNEPFAVSTIERAPKPPVQTAAVAPVQGTAPDTTGSVPGINAARATGEEVEARSGVKVTRQGGDGTPGALIIQVPEALGVRLTPAPDRRLVDKSKYGPIAKIGADGSRPSEIYSRPVVTGPAIKPGAPRIAIVVGGMGIAASATRNAVERLPGPISLAFAPYGNDIDQQVARAREEGHEVLLHAPMETYDERETPGPRMLTTDADAQENIDRLHWMMSRFTGYVGIVNFLGAKFTATEGAVSPLLAEVQQRGLIWLDDGSSPRSFAADGTRAPRVDVVIDGDKTDAAFLKLESIARQKGFAIGMSTALPANVEKIARFAKGLEARGIALVPLSALAGQGPRPSAGSFR